jgi:hypothetical protein
MAELLGMGMPELVVIVVIVGCIVLVRFTRR